MPRTAVESNTGQTFAISPNIPLTFDEAGYEASAVVFTTIGEVETMGPYGVTRQVIEFTPVDTGIVTKMPGSKNYGNMEATLGNVPANAGQAIVKAASESNNHYSVRVTYPDGEVHYLDVIVTSFEYAGGGANDVERVNFGFAVTRAPVVVPAP